MIDAQRLKKILCLRNERSEAKIGVLTLLRGLLFLVVLKFGMIL